MVAKRFFDGDEDPPNQKRPKTKPSFASAIREVVMANFFENFCSALEPMLRRVVSEEVGNELRRRCMSTLLQCPPPKMLRHTAAAEHRRPASLRLAFSNRLSLPIFTGTKIVDAEGNPLQIVLEAHAKLTSSVAPALKIEIVVLDGDFATDVTWSDGEFAKNVVKERTGKRPLLTGDLTVTMKDGVAGIGDIEFTDNSSWIRSRKFRLGARVIGTPGGREVIHEAITEAFVVKDHRGELYKKHHPPALEDNVWRLEKIAKGGAFDQKLEKGGIKTVQDFLKLYYVDPDKLRKILGNGMPDRMWEATVKHAKECVVGNKLYKYHADNWTLTLSPVCKLLRLESNGQIYHHAHFKTMQTAYINNLVKDAYDRWNTLEIVEGPIHYMPLLTQGEEVEQYPNEEQQIVMRSSYVASESCEGNYSSTAAADEECFYLSPNSASINSHASRNHPIMFFSDSTP